MRRILSGAVILGLVTVGVAPAGADELTPVSVYCDGDAAVLDVGAIYDSDTIIAYAGEVPVGSYSQPGVYDITGLGVTWVWVDPLRSFDLDGFACPYEDYPTVAEVVGEPTVEPVEVELVDVAIEPVFDPALTVRTGARTAGKGHRHCYERGGKCETTTTTQQETTTTEQETTTSQATTTSTTIMDGSTTTTTDGETTTTITSGSTTTTPPAVTTTVPGSTPSTTAPGSDSTLPFTGYSRMTVLTMIFVAAVSGILGFVMVMGGREE